MHVGCHIVGKCIILGHHWFLKSPPKPLSNEEILNLVTEIYIKFRGEKFPKKAKI